MIEFKPCIVVPCYRHFDVLKRNIEQIAAFNVDVFVVNDGNNETVVNDFKEFIKSLDNVYVIDNEHNLGKGGSMTKAFKLCFEKGYSHVLQIDADGQQKVEMINVFLEQAKNNLDKLILGTPIYSNVPKHRLISRYITHFWVSIELGIFKIVDSMCGMRVYPLDKTYSLITHRAIGSRMDFDTDIFVRLYWSGVDFIEQGVEVLYYENGVSNFAPFKDNLRISIMHTKLCVEKFFNFIRIHKRCYQ